MTQTAKRVTTNFMVVLLLISAYATFMVRHVDAASPLTGKLIAATNDGPSDNLWARDPALKGVSWDRIGHANGVTAMTYASGLLWAADDNNRLWVRDPVAYEVNWRDVGHADDLRAMAAWETSCMQPTFTASCGSVHP